MSTLINPRPFIEYPKTQTLYELLPGGPNGKKWLATTGKILPATAPLHFLPRQNIVITEKVDGRNMGLGLFGDDLTVQKREVFCQDNNEDQYYLEMRDELRERIFSKRPMVTIPGTTDQVLMDNVIFYGELAGPKVQKGGNYFPKRRFLLFDILNVADMKFYTWSALKHFAEVLELDLVPEVQYPGETLAVEEMKPFIQSLKSVYNPAFDAEGIVIRDSTDSSYYRRYMAKIRRRDF